MNVLNWSRFNFLLETDNDQKYLYNSYTNGLIKLEDSLFNDLIELSKNKAISKKSSLFSEEELNFFVENYILVENDDVLVDKMHHQSLSRIYSTKHLVLTIAPTQSCNFNCSYCYEQWRKSGVMSDETENAIINYISDKKNKEGLESLSLTWYGGEPLLQHKRVVSLASRINQLGLDIHESELITNGYFFTLDVVKQLVDVNISSVQITLDGFKDAHDKRRPLTNGKGSFDTIINNLDEYYNSEYRDSLLIAIRVNIDKRNYKDFVEIYKWLKTKYKSERLIVYPGIIVLDENDKEQAICLSRNEVTDLSLELYKRYNIVTESLYPDDINMECMIRSPHSMLIGSKGEIYKCFEDLGNNELIIGNINNSEVFNNSSLIAKYSVGIDHYNDATCRTCSYLPICRGGCPLRRLENTYMNKTNDCCTPFKGRIKDYIELYSNVN